MTTTNPLSEEEVETFLTKLKQADTDKKVDVIQLFGLKLEDATELPPSTFDALTLSTAPLLRSTSHLLISATLTSFLPFYLPLLPSSPSSTTASPPSTQPLHLSLVHFLPPLFEKLNDSKERTHKSSALCIGILGHKCYEVEMGSPSPSSGTPAAYGGKGKEKESLTGIWERMMKDVLVGKGWRGKVEGMKLLLAMRGEKGSRLPLKPWIPVLVDLLEDQDQNVRDQARETTVALMSPSSTPPQARTELKKLLAARGVRKTISENIISRVLGGGGSAVSTASDVAVAPPEETLAARSGATTPATDEIEIVYVASARDLESEFSQMVAFFQGKETEHNWAQREKSLVRTRGMLRGQAYQQYPSAFLAGIKVILEGIGKTLMSLRTTVAQQACALVLELAERLQASFDASVEQLLPILGKMAGFTKKIIADKSQKALTAIITYTTVPPRLFIAHIMAGMGEKNIQTRQFCTGHLKTFLDVHATRQKHSIESSQGGLEQLENALKKVLGDVNPAVRDLARAAFWSYAAIWPNQAAEVMASLDGVARKQLEKADPKIAGSSSPSSSTSKVPAAPAGKTTIARRVPSAVSAMLAEKRKAAKAAELAGVGGLDELGAPRSVSSPSTQVSKTSTTQAPSTPGPRKSTPLMGNAHSSSSPTPSSTTLQSPSKTTPRAIKPPTTTQSGNLLSRSRSSSLNRPLSASPPSSKGSPASRASPLRQASTLPSGVRSPTSSSATSGPATASLRTPTLTRKFLPSVNGAAQRPADRDSASQSRREDQLRPPPTVSISASQQSLDTQDWDRSDTPTRPSYSSRPVNTSIPPREALESQAAQALSAAKQLVDYEDDNSAGPVTPMRPRNGMLSVSGTGNGNGNGNGNRDGYADAMFRTPVSNNGLPRKGGWEESPRNEAMTPKMLDKLKERRHERSWWLLRQRLLENATPLKTSTPNSESGILPDLEALESGHPSLKNLQRITLFSTDHPISLADDVENGTTFQEVEDERRMWDENKLFDRVFNALISFLQPERPADLLEQALVLLWELIQRQWVLFEDREIPLVDALFRLRTSRNSIILESTNSLISLLTDVSDPLYLFSVIRAALDRYLTLYAEASEVTLAVGSLSLSTSSQTETPSKINNDAGVNLGEKARAAGYLFGLNAIGMCVLKLPSEVVGNEAGGLESLITTAFASHTITTRQAANTLLLAIQCVLQDPQRTLSFFPSMNSGQKDLAIYLMEKNGLLSLSSPASMATASGDRGSSLSLSSSGSGRSGSGPFDGDAGTGSASSPAVKLDRVKGEIVGLLARGSGAS